MKRKKNKKINIIVDFLKNVTPKFSLCTYVSNEALVF